MKQVIAMHGWGGDSNTWNVWAEYFCKNGWTWQSVERGYGNSPPWSPIWARLPSNGNCSKRVVIAHSLGLHLIDSQILIKATDVVLLSSFSSFIPNDNKNRSLRTALKGMQKHLGTSEEGSMLKHFLLKAVHPESTKAMPSSGPMTNGLSIEGRQRLIKDLKLLSETNKLPKGLSAHSRVLVIQGQEDLIIVPSTRRTLIDDLKKHLSHHPTNWSIPGTGHLLLAPELIKDVHSWLVN